MNIGVLSDTHGFLDPRILRIFAGVDHILHAGDIGYTSLILELQAVAPVTAVLGNTDDDIGYRLTETVEVARKKFLVHHIVSPRAWSETLEERIRAVRPDAVVFGHTHRAFAETVQGVFFLNPGYAGRPKPGAERSVAILRWKDGAFQPQFIAL